MNHLAIVISLCLALPVLGQEGNSGDPANNCQMHDHATHRDLVAAHFARRDPARAMRQMTRQANALGLTVSFALIGN